MLGLWAAPLAYFIVGVGSQFAEIIGGGVRVTRGGVAHVGIGVG